MSRRRGAGVGRPEATSHAEIESVAFALFEAHTFERTTLDMIAGEVGVSRRTLFRYYSSKNDIPWGQFDLTLVEFRRVLAEQPPDRPLPEAIGDALAVFNWFPDDAVPAHVTRMRLILQTPALQAHSVLKYAEWRQEVNAFAAARLGVGVGALAPQLLGHVALAVSLTAYDCWLAGGDHSQAALQRLLRDATHVLARIYAKAPPVR